MILDTSYSTLKVQKLILEKTGKAFGFLERIRMGGIGTERMRIVAASEECLTYVRLNHYESNANIELRKSGLIVHFRNKLQEYSWLISYQDLVIVHGDTLRISDKENWVEVEYKKEQVKALMGKLDGVRQVQLGVR